MGKNTKAGSEMLYGRQQVGGPGWGKDSYSDTLSNDVSTRTLTFSHWLWDLGETVTCFWLQFYPLYNEKRKRPPPQLRTFQSHRTMTMSSMKRGNQPYFILRAISVMKGGGDGFLAYRHPYPIQQLGDSS